MSSKTLRFKDRSPTGRSVALRVLLECRRLDIYVQDALDGVLKKNTSLSAADRRLATQLAYTVQRRRGTIDALLRTIVNRPPHDVEPWLWETLRLGVCQLTLLDHVPPHAAIHETVELAMVVGKPRAKGFINGVLRSLAGLVTTEETTIGAHALPLEGQRYRRLARPVLPDPKQQPIPYLSAGFSLPRRLVGRWLERFGWDECVRLGFWFAGPAPRWLRCNALKTDRTAFLTELAVANISAEPGNQPQSVRLLDSIPIRDVPGFDDGWFTVQDLSAAAVGAALAPRPGQRVLDLCAAPGGKTTHLAELMQNQGEIIACDADRNRLAKVNELCKRLGIGIVQTHWLKKAGQAEEPPPGPFDSILVDVPCSNTGVLGRRPEARWRQGDEDLQRLVPLQTRLLIQAAERVRPGGAIVYSTCSIEPDENQQVVKNVLMAMPDLKLATQETQLPGLPADGGYWARLRRQTL